MLSKYEEKMKNYVEQTKQEKKVLEEKLKKIYGLRSEANLLSSSLINKRER